MSIFPELIRWPEKIDEGIKVAHAFYEDHKLFFQASSFSRIVFLGMGGSGIAGKVVKTFLDKKSSIPVELFDHFEVPAYFDNSTLVFVSSFSGNTWEVVERFEKLYEKKIPMIVLSHGGELSFKAQKRNVPFVNLPSSESPRSALGIFLGCFVTILDYVGLLAGKKLLTCFQAHLKQSISLLSNETMFTEVLTLLRAKDYFYVWGIEGDAACSAFRAQTQFNENSKVEAIFAAFPEVNHNLLASFKKSKEKPCIVLFATDFIPESYQKVILAVKEVLKEEGVTLYKVPILGDTWEQQLFHLIVWADFASCYLAEARGVKINPVDLITRLKDKSQHKGILKRS